MLGPVVSVSERLVNLAVMLLLLGTDFWGRLSYPFSKLLRIELFLALGWELGLTVQPRTPRATGPTGRASELARRNF